MTLGRSVTGRPLLALLDLSDSEAARRGVTHTPREIFQQPRMWLATFERVWARREAIAALLTESGVLGPKPPQIVLIGAGSSDFVGRITASAIRERLKCSVSVLPSTDLLTQSRHELAAGGRYLFIWFSRSGTTPEAVALYRRLERDFPDAHQLIVTCNESGDLAPTRKTGRALAITLDPAVNDRGLAMTSSFTSMALVALLVAHVTELDRLRSAVTALSAAGERLLEEAPEAAQTLARRRDSLACFLGSGALRGAAGEAALKLLELSAGRVKTVHESFLGVRHGPLAALDARTLVVGFLSCDPAERSLELDLIEEVRAKSLAGCVALVAPDDDARAAKLADVLFRVDPPRDLPCSRPLLDALLGQLLGLFACLEHGLLPDSPSPNGAIERVVSRVRPLSS